MSLDLYEKMTVEEAENILTELKDTIINPSSKAYTAIETLIRANQIYKKEIDEINSKLKEFEVSKKENKCFAKISEIVSRYDEKKKSIEHREYSDCVNCHRDMVHIGDKIFYCANVHIKDGISIYDCDADNCCDVCKNFKPGR